MFSCPAISFFTLLSSHFINHLFFFTVEHSLSRRSLTFLFGLGPERKEETRQGVLRSGASQELMKSIQKSEGLPAALIEKRRAHTAALSPFLPSSLNYFIPFHNSKQRRKQRRPKTAIK